jgi:GT2 family glycosyltransferase
VKSELRRAHRLLCSRFVAEDLFRAGMGATRADIGAVVTYLNLPPDRRPGLSVYFETTYYAGLNADAIAASDAPVGDALLHFLEHGLVELRSPHPLIDPRFIVSGDPLLLGTPPDADSLLDVLDFDLADPGPYFSLKHYAAQLVGEQPEGGMLRHFLTTGCRRGLRPNPFLDPVWYAAANLDAPRDLWGAMLHFVLVGDREARDPGPNFDAALYLRRYPDVAEAGYPPLLHYLAFGSAEGRQATAEKPVGVAAPPRPSRPVAQAVAAEASAIRAADAELRARLDQARAARKDAVSVAPPPLLSCTDLARDLAALAFPPAPAPRVSVLIPVFNELDVTAECLMSLMAARLGPSVLVIVADDASTDPEAAKLAGVEGLVLVRHAANLGFLRSCNAAFAQCRGEYVLLLNNDTQVLPGAIEAMVAALDADPGLAAVGPKLLYPNGRLQEAGCFVRPNGETGMVGLFADPDEGGFNRDRDVAYCSGAALMLRRSLIGPVLFDEAYAPAYCEDVDLCLRLRAAGHRIRYVHDAEIVHHLSVSTGREGMARRLRLVARNQDRLMARWGDLVRKLDDIRVLAFYLPQFHPTPENDLWWGAGFTEWTNVVKAQPSYVGHDQPHLPADLGFYDLRNPEALAAQAALAARYGVTGFVIYHYNFGKRRVLHRPLEVLVAHPEIAIGFCLCWANENWTKHWDGGTREILLEQSYDDATLDSVIADAVTAAHDPRAITVGGRPLFLVYRPLKLPDAPAFARRCRTAFAEAGFTGVHLVYVESMEAVDARVMPSDLGFDACVEFPPHGRAVPASDSPEILKEGWAGYRYDYPATVVDFVVRDSVPYPRYPAVFPSWDNTPRQPGYGSSFDRATPEAFGVYVEEKIEELRAFQDGDEKLLFVNAWNEWAEGAHLEPDTLYGHRWLEALRGAIERKRAG